MFSKRVRLSYGPIRTPTFWDLTLNDPWWPWIWLNFIIAHQGKMHNQRTSCNGVFSFPMFKILVEMSSWLKTGIKLFVSFLWFCPRNSNKGDCHHVKMTIIGQFQHILRLFGNTMVFLFLDVTIIALRFYWLWQRWGSNPQPCDYPDRGFQCSSHCAVHENLLFYHLRLLSRRDQQYRSW